MDEGTVYGRRGSFPSIILYLLPRSPLRHPPVMVFTIATYAHDCSGDSGGAMATGQAAALSEDVAL